MLSSYNCSGSMQDETLLLLELPDFLSATPDGLVSTAGLGILGRILV